MKAILTSLACLLVVLPSFVYSETRVLDYIRIIVNDEILTNIEVEEALGAVRSQILQSLPEGEERQKALAEMEEKVTENLINDLLLIGTAKKSKIVVGNEEVEQHIARLIEQRPEVEDFYHPDILKELVTKDFLKQRLIAQQVDSKLSILPEEVKVLCEGSREGTKEIHLAQIMFQSSDSQVEEKAQIVRQGLKEGSPFSELAKNYSSDPNGKKNGGILGQFKRGQLLKEIEQVAFALEPKTLSELVKTQFGYHLFYVLDIDYGDESSCSDLPDDLYGQYHEKVYLQKREVALQNYLKELKDKAQIVMKSK